VVNTAAESGLMLNVHLAAPEAFGVTSSFVSGQTDAVLIDGQFTISEGQQLANQIKGAGKNLTTVYVTHQHPDHYFGLVAVKEAFPDARVVALPENVDHIKETVAHHLEEWKPKVGDAIPDEPVIPEPLEGTVIELEGHELQIAFVGQGDDVDNTVVHIPELGALITGDFVYNETHVWMAEATPAQWQQWLASLDVISQIEADVLVAGHKKAGTPDDPEAAVSSTRRYIEDYAAFAKESSSAEELIEKVMGKYGDRDLEVILQISAAATFATVSR
jgi:glyoxylase-like metal-dependent hydrolase (beta-lactamase superfamily II)